jgi:AcrR family transcriptional regulator
MTLQVPHSGQVRRPGYAPTANTSVGRRGLHTRDRIVACAAEIFLANGYHSTSIDAIAKAAGASRATIYQYFAGKDDIFRELADASERAVVAHGDRLGRLGPTADGLKNLRHWLAEWADIYDAHAAVFAEFPGIGTSRGLPVVDVGPVADKFRRPVTERLREARLRGLQPDDAAAALMRIPHMVNLYRHRAMFPLPPRAAVSDSLAIALQLMLFPDTPADALCTNSPYHVHRPESMPIPAEPGVAVDSDAFDISDISPIARDVLAASSQLFAEHGYYAVGMEDIAAAADIGRATLYRYFSTKHKILGELTGRAVLETEQHAAALHHMAQEPFDPNGFAAWMEGYARFHRAYRGVIRAWFDGTAAEQLPEGTVSHGVGSMYQAVTALLGRATLPPGMDTAVAAAVFLAVLGRMTEPTSTRNGGDSDRRAADLMVHLLRRSVVRFG